MAKEGERQIPNMFKGFDWKQQTNVVDEFLICSEEICFRCVDGVATWTIERVRAKDYKDYEKREEERRSSIVDLVKISLTNFVMSINIRIKICGI